MNEGFFTNKKLPVTLTIIILIVGSIIFFSAGETGSEIITKSNGIFSGLKLKASYTPEGQLKVFALAKNNKLKTLETVEGDSIPEYDSMVIGSKEANTMREEKLFTKPNDELKDFFGLNLRVEGILKKTDTISDYFHFVSEGTFDDLRGDSNRLFIKMNNEGIPKVFYTSPLNQTSPIKYELEEGSFNDYKEIHEIAGEKYYPIIIGSTEAKIMREEKLFSKPGDIIKGLFGKNFIVAGIIKPTNTSLDLIHIVPLSEKDLTEDKK